MLKGANPQAPPLDPKWVRFLNARDDMVAYLRDKQGYSNYEISQAMATFIETVDIIVDGLDDAPGGGPKLEEQDGRST